MGLSASPNGRLIRSQRVRVQRLTMTQSEASQCIRRMQGFIVDISKELATFILRQGWKSLGYANATDCLAERLGLGHDGAHRRVLAAECKGQLVNLTPDRHLQATIWAMHDSHTRPLLTLDDPQARLGALIQAEVISTKTGAPVTASTLAGIVKGMTKPPLKGGRRPRSQARTRCDKCQGTGWLSA